MTRLDELKNITCGKPVLAGPQHFDMASPGGHTEEDPMRAEDPWLRRQVMTGPEKVLAMSGHFQFLCAPITNLRSYTPSEEANPLQSSILWIGLTGGLPPSRPPRTSRRGRRKEVWGVVGPPAGASRRAAAPVRPIRNPSNPQSVND